MLPNSKKNKVPFLALKLIFLFSGTNAIFLTILNSFGLKVPTTYLFSSDIFADFLKVVFSYPGANKMLPHQNSSLNRLIYDYITNNPYKSVSALSTGALTHFHLPPLTTVLSLICLKLMEIITVWGTFLLLLGMLLMALAWIAKKYSHNAFTFYTWLLCFTISYPCLFFIQRGNLFSALTSILIIIAIFSVYDQENKYLAIFLLAIAFNIRPNSAIFILTLYTPQHKDFIKKLFLFFSISGFILGVSTLLAHLLYNEYSINNFLTGLNIYHTLYVIGNSGEAYNSSLFGVMKLILGYSKLVEFVSFFCGLIIVLTGLVLHKLSCITAPVYVFLICISYMLGTATFADYHLMVFFAPILLLSKRLHFNDELNYFKNYDLTTVFAFTFSCLLLSPKNYFILHGINSQVIINPIIGLLSFCLILLYTLKKSNNNCDPKSLQFID